MTKWEPTLTLPTLKLATIKKLDEGHAKQVWEIDKFFDAIDDNDLITSWAAHCLAWPEPILPMGGIGADPGVNLAVAYLEAEDVAFTFRCHVDRSEISSASLLRIISSVPILVPRSIARSTPVVVEGAAYDAKYGQPLLGQIRGALILGFDNLQFDTIIEMQPKSVRLRAFGNGNQQPTGVWNKHGFNKDEADALSMAIAAGI